MSEQIEQPIRLLLVDDEEDLVTFLAHRLRKRGLDVTMALSGAEVFEVKLDDRFLMSSLVNTAEIALARLALAHLEHQELHVVVRGLGLGYTARAALAHAARQFRPGASALGR